MKKIFLAFVFVFLTFSTFALEATVVSIVGKVERKDGNDWVPLSVGETLKKGTVISTGFKSEGNFKINDSLLTLKALTRVTIEELVSSNNSDTTRLFMDTGAIKASVKRTEDRRPNFKVRTPVATASVRGTELEVFSSGRINVTEGLVSFSPSTSNTAQVESDDSQPAEIAGAEGEGEHAGLFDSTASIGGEYGIPVGKGQSSSFDTATATCSTPSTEIAKSVSSTVSSTKTLSSHEAISVNPSSSGNLAGTYDLTNEVVSSNANLNITVNFENDN